jgi:4-alpha-glucanotransferase
MNLPGTTSENWRWRLPEGSFDDALRERLRLLNESTGRASAN